MSNTVTKPRLAHGRVFSVVLPECFLEHIEEITISMLKMENHQKDEYQQKRDYSWAARYRRSIKENEELLKSVQTALFEKTYTVQMTHKQMRRWMEFAEKQIREVSFWSKSFRTEEEIAKIEDEYLKIYRTLKAAHQKISCWYCNNMRKHESWCLSLRAKWSGKTFEEVEDGYWYGQSARKRPDRLKGEF